MDIFVDEDFWMVYVYEDDPKSNVIVLSNYPPDAVDYLETFTMDRSTFKNNFYKCN